MTGSVCKSYRHVTSDKIRKNIDSEVFNTDSHIKEKHAYMKADSERPYRWGGRDIVLHRARTDSDFDILAMKPLRKCDGGIGEKILNRFRPSKLFLSQFW